MPFAPIYNDFAKSIFVPIQSLINRLNLSYRFAALNTNSMLGLPVVLVATKHCAAVMYGDVNKYGYPYEVQS